MIKRGHSRTTPLGRFSTETVLGIRKLDEGEWGNQGFGSRKSEPILLDYVSANELARNSGLIERLYSCHRSTSVSTLK